jgi:hypothetical protein
MLAPRQGRQAIFLGAAEPRAAPTVERTRREVLAPLVGQGRSVVSTSGVMFVLFLVPSMKTSLFDQTGHRERGRHTNGARHVGFLDPPCLRA